MRRGLATTDVEIGPLWVCTCCLFAREGDGDGCDGNGGCEGDPWALLASDKGYSVTYGLLSDEHRCGRERGEDVDECDCERNSYSTASCDGCGSPLHGERHAYTLWRELPVDLDAVIAGYVSALLWTESCNGHATHDGCRGEECDASLSHDCGLSGDDIEDASMVNIRITVVDFIAGAVDERPDVFEGIDPDDIGHDFLLTRNGHGTGFWDRGYGERGDWLTERSRPYGEAWATVGDNGKVYVSD